MAHAGEHKDHGRPVTLHAVMKEALGYGLQSRYKPEREIPHGLIVILMQMNEDRRHRRSAKLE